MPVTDAFIRALPKTELHVHMEGSVRPATLLKLAQRHNIALPATDIAGLREWYRFRDFPHFIQVYVAVSKCIRTADDVELIAREFLEGQAAQNIVHTEVTYTASTIEKYAGVSWPDQLAALERARAHAERELGVTMRYILDIVRGDTAERGVEVARWAVEGMGRGVVALGLAGPENGAPASAYTEAFAITKSAGLAIVPHAGETLGAESMWDVLRHCDPPRIGHGIRCLEDPALVAELRARGTVLDVCPSSNVRLGTAASYAAHPFKAMRDAGLRVTIGSDDPPMFDTTLVDEYRLVAESCGYDEATMRELAEEARAAAIGVKPTPP